MLAYYQLDPCKQTSIKFQSKFSDFHSRKCILKCCLLKWQPFYVGISVLTNADLSWTRLHRSIFTANPQSYGMLCAYLCDRVTAFMNDIVILLMIIFLFINQDVYHVFFYVYHVNDNCMSILHKSHNALILYPTMHHFVTEMCMCAHFCYKQNGVLRDICLMYYAICETP